MPSRGPVVILGREQLAQINEHARQAYPGECCGLLIGVRESRIEVRGAHPAVDQNLDRARDRYQLDPREIHQVDVASEREGMEVIGFYHSHPDHPPSPSATDKEHAWPGYVYLISSVTATGPGETRAWVYYEPLGRFIERAVEVVPHSELLRECGIAIAAAPRAPLPGADGKRAKRSPEANARR